MKTSKVKKQLTEAEQVLKFINDYKNLHPLNKAVLAFMMKEKQKEKKAG